MHMATIHISAAEAVRDFATLLARVRAGAEVVVEDGPITVAVQKIPRRRSMRTSPATSPRRGPPIESL
jgi:antitoxin (DNA-binding transcriptional repressor) of toxin-antitoxin stability system